MEDFVKDYRQTYLLLGYDLKSSDGIDEAHIVAAEKRIGVSIPPALRCYYRVAGAETRFNQIFNRLLRPEEWYVECHRVVFMEENQAVVLWAFSTDDVAASDPPVFMGANDDPIVWNTEHEHCSVFLKVMLHWHGAFGGALQHCGTARVSQSFSADLAREWSLVGEVNQMRAYRRRDQAICLLKWNAVEEPPGGESPWRIFAGATSRKSFDQLATELDVLWEDYPPP